tara:strand:- start:306 stop:485 length:180 start_codon:yes stop_codon:yes gene_type:complete
MTPSGHGTDIDTFVSYMILHPHSVTENRTSSKGRRRIDSQDRHPLVYGANNGRERSSQR